MTTSCPRNAKYLIPQQTLRIYQWWPWPIHFSIGTDGEYIFTDGELTYHRYRRTGFSRATVASRNNANFLICQRILRTYDGRFIYLSVRTDNIYLPMVNWLTINTDGTVGQCFGGLPYARAMLTTSFVNGLHQFTDMVDSFLHRTDGQYLFTDGELAYHRYRRTRFWRATLCLRARNVNYLICQRTFHIYRWWIHFFIGTDGEYLFTDGELAYHRYQ